jgi:bifunctional non-homologous end joining protein LigD
MNAIPATKTKVAKKKTAKPTVDVKEIEITHPERVVYPDSKITKGDVAAYYAAVYEPLLREAANRPLSIVRCPRGTHQACFFQKHIEAGFGDDVHAVSLKENSGTVADYVYIDDVRGLIELAQMNVIELHAWGTRKDDPDHSDRIVFDLDPGVDVAWKDIAKCARTLRTMLEKLRLRTFLRTSGGKGLHVVLPLSPSASWDETRPFAEAVARLLAAEYPDHYVATSGEKNRKGKIFIDYLRNGRGATSVTNYSLRARPGAPVAMPISWEELSRLRAANAFTLKNVKARLKRSNKDPWAGIEKLKQKLPNLSRLTRD